MKSLEKPLGPVQDLDKCLFHGYLDLIQNFWGIELDAADIKDLRDNPETRNWLQLPCYMLDGDRSDGVELPSKIRSLLGTNERCAEIELEGDPTPIGILTLTHDGGFITCLVEAARISLLLAQYDLRLVER